MIIIGYIFFGVTVLTATSCFGTFLMRSREGAARSQHGAKLLTPAIIFGVISFFLGRYLWSHGSELVMLGVLVIVGLYGFVHGLMNSEAMETTGGHRTEPLPIPNNTYRDTHWEFEMTFPDGWRGGASESPLTRSFLGGGAVSDSLAFYGDPDECIRFAIGPIAPEPSVEQQQWNLQRIAMKRGERIVEVGSIHVGGRQHATIIVDIPSTGRLKHYSLIFRGIEFFVSARAPESIADSIVESFRLV